LLGRGRTVPLTTIRETVDVPKEGGPTAEVVARRWQWTLLALLLTLLYLIPRLIDSNQVVTIDEAFWLARSANFYRALWQGDFAATFQFAHPGVTTMWAGMVGYWFAAPGYVDVYDTNLDHVYTIHRRLREMGLLELDVLAAARIAKIGLQAILYLLSLLWLRRLFGGPIAVVAGAIIALDPFLIAHDRRLHVDGLVAISSFVAVLALADAVMRGRRRVVPWVVAGCLAAVAWLTRITGLVLIGVAGLVLLIQALAGNHGSLLDRVRTAMRNGIVWLAAALGTTVILWPAIWAAPDRVLSFTLDWVSGAAAEGHEHPLYFMGDIYTGDPGPLFYPLTIVWRLSLASSVGLLLTVVVLVVPRIRRTLPEAMVRASGILLLFALLSVAMMTLGAKKFDRYVLPVYPVLDTIAAIGIVVSLQWLLPRREQVMRVAMSSALLILLLAQAVITFGYRPYFIVAYNPLLGGAEAAARVLHMGSGEGVDAAARWVIDDTGIQPGDQVGIPPVLRIAGAPVPLLYMLPPPYVVESQPIRSIEEWERTDYYVVSIQQWRIQQWPLSVHGTTIGYLEQFEPAHTIWIEGVRYVEVWDLEAIPPPPWLTGAPECAWTFSSWLQLENIVIEGEEMTLWFQTLTADGLPEAVTVTLELVPRSLETPAIEETWSATFAPRPRSELVTDVTLTIPPLASSGMGAYLPTITVTDADTGEPLPAVPPGQDRSQRVAVITPRCGLDGTDVEP
jgi:hypothetical protein